MARANPNVQQRNQYGRDWGNYSSLDVCPNAVSWAGGSNPTSPLERGDRATVDNIGPVYCVSAGTPGLLDAVWARDGAENTYEGFQTDSLADYYVVPAASGGLVCPGADNYILVTLVTPFTVRDGTGFNMVAQCAGAAGGVARGWRMHWSTGTDLEADVYVTGPGVVTALTGTTAYSASFGKLGHVHALAQRVYQSGGSTVLELWCGPAIVASASGAAGVIPASDAADRMRLGSGQVFGNERPLNGGIYGFGYYEGTITRDAMRSLMGRCYTELAIPDILPWTNRWNGSAVATAPASWPAADGGVALERVGAPTGSTSYFPPV